MRLSLFKRKPDPDRIEVPHAGTLFPVAVKRRASARRMTLRVSQATGEITLTLPERADFGAGKLFAEKHGGWIAARMAKRPDSVPFEAGAIVPFRGVDHRIVHWSKVRGLTQATTDKDGTPIIAVAGEAVHVPRRVKDFLRRAALEDLERAVRVHTGTLGIPARKITIRDTTSRWGSCSSKGHLNFSWRLILAPPLVLDYLAAHEVAHLKEMNHSHRFWALTHKLCPRTEEAEAWLKRHGAGLHGFG
ncbi:M48 family metallopeptidase [Bosea sp. PAMC 26642]|uniref:M48 family metallopeptidase n=1 Tax=Bosea sp. (strain PAMC 26642) TaxID=1792307 RepID=UPI0007702414|nr:SprT family zinc-dependent metalloprotease [Bosea sp. PAMC 26642]AMJ62389.1 metal-dependent hydrolase [Bosea sp. PAMC 26642]